MTTCLNRLFLQELEREVIEKERAVSDPDAPRLTSFIGIDRLTDRSAAHWLAAFPSSMPPMPSATRARSPWACWSSPLAALTMAKEET